jgi:competence protein ComEA
MLRLASGFLLLCAVVVAQTLPDNPGREIFETICSECHPPAKVIGQQKTRSEWQLKVTEMLQEDPDVTQAERETIIGYLATSFPRKVNVNKASTGELKDVLEISTADAEAITRYREQKGNFKSADDLRKVPGLDASKIERKRGLLEF